MNKQKIMIITGFAVIAAAALFSLYLRTPQTPVILTYQASEPSRAIESAAQTAPGSAESAPESTRPEKTTAAAARTETVTTEAQPLCRDLNAATAEDLQRVSGIGAALAAEIIRYREAAGGFRRRSELLEIGGIGEVLAKRIMAEFEIPGELPPEEPADRPQQDEPPEPEPEPPQQAEEPVGPYDANAVTKEELLRIPDMTEELADAILALREQIGGFRGIYEITLADKLSGRYFEDVLRNYLYVTDDPYSIPPP